MHLRDANEKHELLALDSLNPFQTLSLLSGDWTANLPESIRPIAKNLLGSDTQNENLSGLLSSGGLSGSTSSTSGTSIPQGLIGSQNLLGFNF